MNSSSWMALLGILALCTVLSFSAMKKMRRPLPEYKGSEVTQTVKTEERTSQLDMAASLPFTAAADYDVLWKKSLFQDDRTENDGEEAAADTVQTNENAEFELIGLARIGRKDATVPVAIILQLQNARADNRRNQGRNQGRNQTRQPQPPTPSQQTKDEGDRRANKSIYRTGDAIGNTGYTVKSISMEEDKVVIERNGQEVTLVLDEKNTNNSLRREQVKKQELDKRAQLRNQEIAAEEQAKQAKAKQAQNNETAPATEGAGQTQGRAQAAPRPPQNDRRISPRPGSNNQTATSGGTAAPDRETQPAQRGAPGAMPPPPPVLQNDGSSNNSRPSPRSRTGFGAGFRNNQGVYDRFNRKK